MQFLVFLDHQLCGRCSISNQTGIRKRLAITDAFTQIIDRPIITSSTWMLNCHRMINITIRKWKLRRFGELCLVSKYGWHFKNIFWWQSLAKIVLQIYCLRSRVTRLWLNSPSNYCPFFNRARFIMQAERFLKTIFRTYFQTTYREY